MPLPKPIGRQADVLYYPDTPGHLVVLGTAGSGKTTLAIHRAVYLANTAKNSGRTLLVTYNKMLTTYLNALEPKGLTNVEVRNYHAFARGYLSSRGALGGNDIAHHETRANLVDEALTIARKKFAKSAILSRDPRILDGEFEWIEHYGIRTEAEYLQVERVRAGVRLTRAERPHVWLAYVEYQKARAAAGYRYDWDDLAMAVEDQLAADSTPRRYRHIVIDEGQDFSPSMLRSLTAAIPKDGTLTFFGDVAQQIYGSRVSWRDAGLKVTGNSVIRFEENYRNTKEIAALAVALANGPHFEGSPDLVVPRAPKAAGEPPTVVTCKTSDKEFDFVLNLAAQYARNRSVAVLTRNRSTEAILITNLRAKKVAVERLHRDTSTWDAGPRVWVGTFHSAKGLEFDAVIVPNLDDDYLPDADRIALFGDDADVTRDAAKLLYVAITRARSTLVMTHSKNLTRLLQGIDSKLFKQAKA